MTVTDGLSAAAAMVDNMHAPEIGPGGIPRERTPAERAANAMEAVAYGALAIAEEIRSLRMEVRR